jgi:hypothetical protein
MLAKRAKGELPTSDEPERYCPKCGRPYLLHTKICPFCRDNKEIYKKLWGMTRGLRLMMLFPLLAAIISVAFRFVLPFVQKIAIPRKLPRHDHRIQIGCFIIELQKGHPLSALSHVVMD